MDKTRITSLFDLGGKVAFLSGASSGIGASAAELLATCGAHVIVSSRKLEDCESVAQQIKKDGGSAEAIKCHIGDLQQIKEVFEHISSKHGKLDILVNNAAINPYYGPIWETDARAYDKTMEVNTKGYFFCSVEAVKIMLKQKIAGSIVNVSSVGGLRPGLDQGVYSISKAAVIHMTKAFAKECGPRNIRVNAILPGLTKTKFAAALFENDEIYKEYTGTAPLRRHADPEEIASAILYIVSKGASFATGECMVVDGGAII